MLTSHPYVQYALLTALAAFFYRNPAVGQAVLSALALLETSSLTTLPLLPTGRR